MWNEFSWYNWKPPSRGVLLKRCSENMQQIYWRSVISIKLLCNHYQSLGILLLGGCSLVLGQLKTTSPWKGSIPQILSYCQLRKIYHNCYHYYLRITNLQVNLLLPKSFISNYFHTSSNLFLNKSIEVVWTISLGSSLVWSSLTSSLVSFHTSW